MNDNRLNLQEFLICKVNNQYEKEKDDVTSCTRYKYSGDTFGFMFVIFLFSSILMSLAPSESGIVAYSSYAFILFVTLVTGIVFAVLDRKHRIEAESLQKSFDLAHGITQQELSRIMTLYGERHLKQDIVQQVYGNNPFGSYWYDSVMKYCSEYTLAIQHRDNVKAILAA